MPDLFFSGQVSRNQRSGGMDQSEEAFYYQISITEQGV